MEDVNTGVIGSSEMGVVPDSSETNGVASQEIPESTSPVEGEGTTVPEEGASQTAPEELPKDVAGLQATVQAERMRRQNEAAARQLAEDKALFLQNQLNAVQQREAKVDPLSAIADDEFVSGERLKAIVTDIRTSTEQRNQAFVVRYTSDIARKTYSDFDKAVTMFEKYADPTEKFIIMTSDNPGERVYRYGVSHPDYQKETIKKTAKDVIDKINTNVNTQKTLSSKGGGGISDTDEVKRIMEMSDDDLETMINNVKYGGK